MPVWYFRVISVVSKERRKYNFMKIPSNPSKVSGMSYLPKLKRQHRVFAEETFIFLLNYPRSAENSFPRYELFQPYIGHAILTISYIFRKDYKRLFRRIRENLNNVKMFERYCMVVPVKTDRRYFYYILMRASLIFDLSLYCFNKGYNYFETGRKCLADYKDLEYFESAGGWNKLGHTALYVASLGQPLTLLMAQRYTDLGKRIRTFDEALAAVDRSFIISANLGMLDGAEMYCLRELSKVYQTQTRSTIDYEEKKKPERENGSSQHQNTPLKVSSSDTNSSDGIIITEYFKTCWHDFISSVTLGYSVKNLQHDLFLRLTTHNVESNSNNVESNSNNVECNSSNVESNSSNVESNSSNVECNSSNVESNSSNVESNSSNVESNSSNVESNSKNASSNLNIDFSGKKVAYIGKYKSFFHWALMGLSVDFLEIEDNSPVTPDGNKSLLGAFLCASNTHFPGFSGSGPLLPNRKDPSWYFVDFVLSVNNLPEIHYPPYTTDLVNAPPHTNNCKAFENLASEKESTLHTLHQHANNYKIFENLASEKESILHTTFIVPKSYMRLKETGDTSKCMHLYSIKMCPPSRRKELSEPLKALLDENIENQNYHKMPSGDLLVCPFESSRNKDILIVLAESSADVVDEFIDMLICKFKKLEMDSNYSLRPRQPTSLENEKSKCDLDKADSKSEDMISDEENPFWDLHRSEKRQRSRSAGNENLYAKTFISLYKRNINLFLDEYFKSDFTPASKLRKEPRIKKECVFAVSASIMAKRKVILDEPDEMKRLIGIRLYDVLFQPVILPLDVQRALDYHIRKRNFFEGPNGAYGVGLKGKPEKTNIWVIFYSGDGKSKNVDYIKEDVKEVSEMFHSYEHVLKSFMPSSDQDTIALHLQSFRTLIDDLVSRGFPLHPDCKN